jgi:hypothetical protein
MARIEIKEDPRKVKHVDPITRDLLGVTPLCADGAGVFVNGICSGYCDGVGMPVNIIRRGLALLEPEILAAIEKHYGSPARSISFIDGIRE